MRINIDLETNEMTSEDRRILRAIASDASFELQSVNVTQVEKAPESEEKPATKKRGPRKKAAPKPVEDSEGSSDSEQPQLEPSEGKGPEPEDKPEPKKRGSRKKAEPSEPEPEPEPTDDGPTVKEQVNDIDVLVSAARGYLQDGGDASALRALLSEHGYEKVSKVKVKDIEKILAEIKAL